MYQQETHPSKVKNNMSDYIEWATNNLISKLENVEVMLGSRDSHNKNKTTYAEGDNRYYQESTVFPAVENSGDNYYNFKPEPSYEVGNWYNQNKKGLYSNNRGTTATEMGYQNVPEVTPPYVTSAIPETNEEENTYNHPTSNYEYEDNQDFGDDEHNEYSESGSYQENKQQSDNYNNQTFNLNENNDDNGLNVHNQHQTPGLTSSDPQLRWHWGREGFVPPQTEPVAKTKLGLPVYAGRVDYEGNIIPAVVFPQKNLAFFSWNGIVLSTNNYQVLEVHSFAWKDEGSAWEMGGRTKPVLMGRASDGRPLYLGRVYMEGMGPWVGRIHRDENYIYTAFQGNELRIPQPYEVFVTY